MDADTLQRATEPLFTTKGVGNGTGLGLSMVHGLLEQSGGRLQIRSVEGEGTTMEIWRPVAPAESVEMSAPAAPTQPALPDSRPLCGLAVDDDLLVLKVWVAQLEDLGHATERAGSAHAALALLGESQHFDLVITDHAMPGFTGIQLIRRMAESWPAMPVIRATGYAELGEHETLDAIRLRKPFTRQELVAALHPATGSSIH
jgi:CheY-like chemotaxis protein